MKAKTMLGLIACASACVSLSAFANETNDWFGVTVEGSNVGCENVFTNNVGEAKNGRLELVDVLQEEALAFTPDATFAGTNRNDGVYVIKATALLTPCSTNEFDVVPDAKAGFAVGIDDHNATNYYGYVGGEWLKLTGATVVDGADTAFRIVLNYRDNKVDFYVGDGEETHLGNYNLTFSTSAPICFDAWGVGSIASVAGGYEVAVAAYGDKKYGSIAEASDAVKAASAGDPTATVRVVNADGTTDAAGAVAANGLSEIVCKALGLSMSDSTANIAVAPAGTDDDTTKITLAVNVDAASEASAVKFGVTPVGGGETIYYDDASAIKIPLTAGTYTITPVLK